MERQKTALKKGPGRPNGAGNRKEIWKAKFIEHLSEQGCVTAAAKMAGVNRSNLYKERQTDAQFARNWEEAKEMGVEALVDEATRRAFGVDKPVFYKGKQVGTIKEYSDVLLMFLLKAAKPEIYRDNYRPPVQPVSDPIPMEPGGFVKAMLAHMEARKN